MCGVGVWTDSRWPWAQRFAAKGSTLKMHVPQFDLSRTTMLPNVSVLKASKAIQHSSRHAPTLETARET
jgi:hypothetical protein